MTDYRYVLFDLDGTLTDSFEGIGHGLQYALCKMGRSVPPMDQLRKYCGPPLRETFANDFGMTEEEGELALKYYREYYRETGMWENGPVSGMQELVHALYAQGFHCAVATSKPENHACMIACKYGFMEYMDTCGGCSSDGVLDAKYLVVEEVLRRLRLADKRQAVLVGDRFHDVQAAHKCGIHCIGVAFGYGGRKELTEYKADVIVDTVDELYNFFLRR